MVLGLAEGTTAGSQAAAASVATAASLMRDGTLVRLIR